EVADVQGGVVGPAQVAGGDADADVPRQRGAALDGAPGEADAPGDGAGVVEPEVEGRRVGARVVDGDGEGDDLAGGRGVVVERRRELLVTGRRRGGVRLAGDGEGGLDERAGVAAGAVADAHLPVPRGGLPVEPGEAGEPGGAVGVREVLAVEGVVGADEVVRVRGLVAHRLGILRRAVEEGDRGGADEVGGVAAAAGAVVRADEVGPVQHGEDLPARVDDLDGDVADPRVVDARGELDGGDVRDRGAGEVEGGAGHGG